jgi:site-specific DNA-methyltransferase (adenine-specific)
MPDNLLYYGDNLDILRRHIRDESVDLIYLDPPFKSGQSYNVLFKEYDGSRAAAQIRAFEDTWEWGPESASACQAVVESGGRASQVMQAFRTFLGTSTMMAYLAMMAPRLVELHRVLKPTGSLYLHCDPTASHYLKMLMDAVFGPQNYRNEIVWRRTGTHNDARRFANVHDCILYYGRSKTVTWNRQYLPHSPKYVKGHYRPDENGRLYRLDNIIRSASCGPSTHRGGFSVNASWSFRRSGATAHRGGQRWCRHSFAPLPSPLTSCRVYIPPANCGSVDMQADGLTPTHGASDL